MWSELSKIWDQIDEMKEKTWLSVAPRKLRTQIDALLTQMRDMPARLRHYPSYEFVKKLLQSYAKVNGSFVNLVNYHQLLLLAAGQGLSNVQIEQPELGDLNILALVIEFKH